MNLNRPAMTLCLGMLSLVAPRLAAGAVPVAPANEGSTQGQCIELYRQMQHEARTRSAAINGDYSNGWNDPKQYLQTLTATVLQGFKDTTDTDIRRQCAGDARTRTMDMIANTKAILARYDR